MTYNGKTTAEFRQPVNQYKCALMYAYLLQATQIVSSFLISIKLRKAVLALRNFRSYIYRQTNIVLSKSKASVNNKYLNVSATNYFFDFMRNRTKFENMTVRFLLFIWVLIGGNHAVRNLLMLLQNELIFCLKFQFI